MMTKVGNETRKSSKRIRTKKNRKTPKNKTLKGGGLFDRIKTGFSSIKDGLTSKNSISLDETDVKNRIEKKMNLNNKLIYISDNFTAIITKHWDKLLSNPLDSATLDKIIKVMKNIGYYDDEEVNTIVSKFGKISTIKQHDIKTCIRLILFIDHLYELNEISSRFIVKPHKTGKVQTDVWEVLKDLVATVSEEIDFNTVYKDSKEQNRDKILKNFNFMIETYKDDVPAVVTPTVLTIDTTVPPVPPVVEATPVVATELPEVLATPVVATELPEVLATPVVATPVVVTPVVATELPEVVATPVVATPVVATPVALPQPNNKALKNRSASKPDNNKALRNRNNTRGSPSMFKKFKSAFRLKTKKNGNKKNNAKQTKKGLTVYTDPSETRVTIPNPLFNISSSAKKSNNNK